MLSRIASLPMRKVQQSLSRNRHATKLICDMMSPVLPNKLAKIAPQFVVSASEVFKTCKKRRVPLQYFGGN
ncbi:hypothetical protein J6590_023502 [Homalodisca vitripennis]|nr:hypothetical protein J6590_023502 [Homalodisca vitripennis]